MSGSIEIDGEELAYLELYAEWVKEIEAIVSDYPGTVVEKVKAMKAVVDKLPKDSVGQRIVQGDTRWVIYRGEYDDENQIGEARYLGDVAPWCDYQWEISNLDAEYGVDVFGEYPTEEEARAAAEQESPNV